MGAICILSEVPSVHALQGLISYFSGTRKSADSALDSVDHDIIKRH
jgi:hypothetical protein